MKRLAVLTIAILVASTQVGCVARTREGRIATIAGGAAVAAAGFITYAALGDDARDTGLFIDEGEDEDDLGQAILIGLPALIVGVVGLAVAAVNLPPVADEQPSATSQGVVAPTIADLRGTDMRPLPEVYTDKVTLGLARAVRDAVLADDCATAATLMEQIVTRDPRYHAALSESMVIEGCR